MKINIVKPEGGWILEKFALRLYDELIELGEDVTLSNRRSSQADINHYLMFDFLNFLSHDKDTFMICHVDQNWQVRLLKDRLDKCGMGICMSSETLNKLTSYGLPRRKMCYVSPAHDFVVKPRKYKIGITHRCYGQVDFRKRESMLVDIAKEVDKEYVAFAIMGTGWNEIVDEIKGLGFEVDYYDEFDYYNYVKLIQELDYYLFFGEDEGSMGFLDALAAGVETIVTPQGFHLDVKDGIPYSCRTVEEFVSAINKICEKKKKRVESVQELSWENFARKHLEVWHYLMGDVETKELFKNKGRYNDGIFSVLPEDFSVHSFLVNEIQNRDYKKIAARAVRRVTDFINGINEEE